MASAFVGDWQMLRLHLGTAVDVETAFRHSSAVANDEFVGTHDVGSFLTAQSADCILNGFDLVLQ